MSDSFLPQDGFHTTHWSLVLRAGRSDPAALAALETLCERYWFPLYAYARRRVSSIHEAQDLTQEFFCRLLEKQVLAGASPGRGRFRGFLLAALKNFLANEWDRAHAEKRGGRRTRISLDWDAGESRYRLEPRHDETPERLFERQWALSLLDTVIQSLQKEFVDSGKVTQFELLKEALTAGGHAVDYNLAAAALEISPAAVRQAVHRLRMRYRDLLREEVSRTVGDPAEIDDELRSLLDALGT